MIFNGEKNNVSDITSILRTKLCVVRVPGKFIMRTDTIVIKPEIKT